MGGFRGVGLHVLRAPNVKALFKLLLVGALWPTVCWSDVYVIASAKSPLTAISARELQSLYMGRTRALGDMALTRPIDLPTAAPARNAFYKAVTGMGPAQVNSYWARLMFSGQTLPPVMVASETALLSQLLMEPSAIGYSASPPKDDRFRVLTVLKEAGG